MRRVWWSSSLACSKPAITYTPIISSPNKSYDLGSIFILWAGRRHICESNMNKEQYLDVLKNRLLPQMEEWRANDVCKFMQDNAPCHTAKFIKKFFEDQHINVLDWPGNSPDLNPIENPN